ncbi:MAG: C4-type zinc ribbon domain-containing protein [Actinomycetota bacterium]|nr:C4-type zinc ribbon domain-containing protein [Actinomycetota bacterium]
MEILSFADLLDVQDLDLQIDRLLEQRQSLPELDEYKSAHSELGEITASRDAAASDLKQRELDLDKSEGELELLEIKLDEHETRLFAGGMSARETEHMRLEVQGLKGQREAMEERVLKLLDEIDPVKDLAANLESEVGRVTATKEALESSIKDQWRKIDAELARKEERKKEAIAPVDAELMELYEKLRRIKEGVAVAAFDHGVCGGCHMTLSPAEQEEAFDADLPRCVHCRRILVA